MSDERAIHIVYPLNEDRTLSPLEVRVASHSGSVEYVAIEIQRGIESHGHVIEHEGGDFTGTNRCRALTWQITVTLESGYVGRWQHIVREHGDQWVRIAAETVA